MFNRSREKGRERRVLMRVALGALCFAAFGVLQVSQAEADPLTSVKVDDVASASWSGPSLGTVNSPYGDGSVSNIGDVNGDGVPDIAVTRQNSVAILFTPGSGHVRDLSTNDLPASRGYIVSTPAGAITSIAGIGDQNGDGVPDLAIGDGLVGERVIVVYGVKDPTTLPGCQTGTSKCVDASNLSTMPLSTGYVLNTPTSGDGDLFFGISVAGVEGFTGSGSNDFAIGTPGGAVGNGAVYVVKGSFDPASSPVDITALPATDVLMIEGSQFAGAAGGYLNGLGDMNGDGFGDLYISEPSFGGSNPGRDYVLYGGDDLSNPLDLADVDGSQGFTMAPPILSNIAATNAGDVNGDGRPDLALGGYGLISSDGSAAVIYGPSSPPTAPISITAPTTDQGYAIKPGDTGTQFGTAATNAGDLNGDGVPDQLFSAVQTQIGGNSSAGAVSLAFGQRPTPVDPLTLGSSLTPDLGVALVGGSANDRLGSGLASLGDIDRDGLPDYAVASPGAQRLYLVLGSSLIGQAKTGQAGSVMTDAAMLGGFGVTNGRNSTAYFEYGTSDAYGSQTPVENLNSSRSVDATVTGLVPNTEYRYRLVVVNDLGLKAYGTDRMFKTAAAPVDRCVADSTLPGCPDYDESKFCEQYPTQQICQEKPKVARLSGLISSSSASAVRRGGTAVISAWITSTGTADATGVKVCAKVPRRLAKITGGSCRTIGGLASGATGKAKFKIKVNSKARKRAKVRVNLVASAEGLGNKSMTMRFTVK